MVEVAPYPQDAQTLFCLWYALRPQRRQRRWVVFCLLPIDGVPFDMISPDDWATGPSFIKPTDGHDYSSSSNRIRLLRPVIIANVVPIASTAAKSMAVALINI